MSKKLQSIKIFISYRVWQKIAFKYTDIYVLTILDSHNQD